MSSPDVWVVIPAAGVGSRVGADIPKQYIPLLGQPLISHTLQAFIDCPCVRGIVVALSSDDAYAPDVPQLSDEKVTSCIGGEDRASSVLAGLQALHVNDGDWVMVHDAARPCITPEVLAQFVSTVLSDGNGGLLAIPVADTLKRIDHEHCSAGTVDRSTIWRAQTPQMFRHQQLVDALCQAQSEQLPVTDEASAIELQGGKPLLVPGFNENIKVTFPSDIALAEFYLSRNNGCSTA